MKRLVVPLAILGMMALLGAAAAWDCLRLEADARHRVSLADQEMHKHESRLVKLLSASSQGSPEMQSAISAYEKAQHPRARHAAYEHLVATFRKATSDEVDPTNPLDRKFMDDVAGAINRREVAEKPYDEELAIYNDFLGSFRGRVARFFSANFRAN